MAIAQWSVIERLQTTGSIHELAMRRSVLGKESSGPSRVARCSEW